MNNSSQVFSELWPILLSIIGFIVWLVRLEGKTNENSKENARTQKQVDALMIRHESLDSKFVQQLSDVKESLARIEGKLGVVKSDRLN